MASLTGKSRAGPAASFSVIHCIVILLSLAMTFGAWLYSKNQAEQQIEARFEAARDQTVDLIEERMSRYEDALWSGVAHADSLGGAITLQDWRSFANSLRIEEKYPGVNGIGVIFEVSRDDLPAFLAEQEAEGWPLQVYPAHDRDVLLPITYIVPEDINAKAIGLDVAHETNRRTALLASRDTGTAQITGPIVLVQDSAHTSGFLFYTPFYRGTAPATLEDRREQFAGVVYAPFVVRKLVEGLLSTDRRSVRFAIRDGGQTIYDERMLDDNQTEAAPMFSDSVTLDLYGRQWTIDLWTTKAFRLQNAQHQPTFILVGGLIIEALVIALLVMLTRSNRKAHDYAEQLTSELRAKTDRLERANAEIEQFVYIASHDLKTPVRGIGFLTDNIEEDLVGRIGSMDGNPDIKSQLDMIRKRVIRMQDLTKGIMDFFRAGNLEEEGRRQLPVRPLIAELASDFEVRPDQIVIDTEVETVGHDAGNFQRVLENLIGNAIKYHPHPPEALVTVRIRDAGERLAVSVQDNGKGIAPEFHEKIFSVFQTLQRSRDPGSTGIGLAIVKKAVEFHGGHVSVASAEGQGATFCFTWPKHAAAAGEMGRAA